MQFKTWYLSASLAGFALLTGLPAYSQNVDCSVIKNNPESRKRCEAGQAEAKRWQKEADHHKMNEQRIKEGLRDTANLAKECIKGKGKCVKEALKPKKAE